MRKIIITGLCYIAVLNCGCRPGSCTGKLNLNDSIAVKEFIQQSTLCDQLEYAAGNLHSFVANKGYSLLILESISKQTKRNLFVPVSNGGPALTENQSAALLGDQVNELQKLTGCKQQ